jgi:hypothetical protein
VLKVAHDEQMMSGCVRGHRSGVLSTAVAVLMMTTLMTGTRFRPSAVYVYHGVRTHEIESRERERDERDTQIATLVSQAKGGFTRPSIWSFHPLALWGWGASGRWGFSLEASPPAWRCTVDEDV